MATLDEVLDNIIKRLNALEAKNKSTDTKNTEQVQKPFSLAGSIDVGDSLKALNIQRGATATNGLFNDGSIDATTHANKKTVVWDRTNNCWKFYAVYYSSE